MALSGQLCQCDVAVLGCGNMGSAIVRAALATGRRVAVWNRTLARSHALAANRAVVMESAHDAILAAPVSILCLSTTADVLEVLGTLDPSAAEKSTILNLTSGTPDEGERLGVWAEQRGIAYLDGAILAYPEQIGSPDARFLIGGAPELWLKHQELVYALAGASSHVGSNAGAANVLDAGLVGAFYITAVVAFIEASRFMTSSGVSERAISSLVNYAVSQLEGEMQDVLRRLEKSEFATDQASLTVYHDAAQTFLNAMSAFGTESAVTTAAVDTLRSGVKAGFGVEDISALVKLATGVAQGDQTRS